MPGEKRQWPQEPREGYTAVGRVVRAHGLRGELRVVSFSASGVNLQPGRFVELDGQRRRVHRARPDRDAWILQLDGLRDRTQAEQYRGALLEVPDTEVERESEDSYFIHELIGLRVITSDGAEVGEIVDVLQPGANDVYVVRGPRGEVLVPAIAEVIERVDVAGGVIFITPLPGMLDESK
ncbi:MAG: ribosome maturation factor RimM [Dehalococcoidia bacterium]|nr:ribosome maturation factor RimM [Dehalococcoidia bacterium]